MPDQLLLVISANAGIQGLIATYPQPLDSRQQQRRIPFFAATFLDRHSRERGNPATFRGVASYLRHDRNHSSRRNGEDAFIHRAILQTVIPAKAGIQRLQSHVAMRPWIPAFAGMTTWGFVATNSKRHQRDRISGTKPTAPNQRHQTKGTKPKASAKDAVRTELTDAAITAISPNR